MLHISYRKPSKNPKNKLEDLHLYQEYRAISHLLKKFIAKKKKKFITKSWLAFPYTKH